MRTLALLALAAATLTACTPDARPCADDDAMEIEGTVIGRDVEASTLTVRCLADPDNIVTVKVHPVVVDITPDGDWLTVPKGYTP